MRSTILQVSCHEMITSYVRLHLTFKNKLYTDETKSHKP